jgi:hypothetical protein
MVLIIGVNGNGSLLTAERSYIKRRAYRSLILDEAQKLFELMVRDLTSRIINETALTIHSQTT